jgi:hypothetical protein
MLWPPVQPQLDLETAAMAVTSIIHRIAAENAIPRPGTPGVSKALAMAGIETDAFVLALVKMPQ